MRAGGKDRPKSLTGLANSVATSVRWYSQQEPTRSGSAGQDRHPTREVCSQQHGGKGACICAHLTPNPQTTVATLAGGTLGAIVCSSSGSLARVTPLSLFGLKLPCWFWFVILNRNGMASYAVPAKSLLVFFSPSRYRVTRTSGALRLP